MARLYQKINGEAVPLGGGGGGSVAIDNETITTNSDDEIQVATTLTGKINQLNNSASDMGKVLTANGNGTASWDDVLVPIDYETITKNGDGELQVSSMPYDNTESGLTATNVQDAIDELNDEIADATTSVNMSAPHYEISVQDYTSKVYSIGIITVLDCSFHCLTGAASGGVIMTIPEGFRPKVNTGGILFNLFDNTMFSIDILTNGDVKVWLPSGTSSMPSGKDYKCSVVYYKP